MVPTRCQIPGVNRNDAIPTTHNQNAPMKTTLLFGATMLAAAVVVAADSPPKSSTPKEPAKESAKDSALKDEVSAAAKALGNKSNYSWRTVVVVPEDAMIKPGPTDGTTEKDGYTHYKMTFFDNPFQVVQKGDKAAFTDQDGGWRSAAEAENDEGPGRFMGSFARDIQAPAEDAATLASYTKELKKDGEAYVSDLTEEGAKRYLTFRRRNAGDGVTVANPKGSVKFWIKDGVLTKYEYKVKGTVNWNGNEFENDRTTTVDVKEVGTTKVQVPEEAKKKLS